MTTVLSKEQLFSLSDNHRCAAWCAGRAYNELIYRGSLVGIVSEALAAEYIAVLARALRSIPCDERGVYIKSGAHVTFGTLDLILHSVKKACINQIEIVFDKKKVGGKNITPMRAL